ncbi:MAG TPA: PadR family transcriptional regulator [Thermoleophilaceae bacterium]
MAAPRKPRPEPPKKRTQATREAIKRTTRVASARDAARTLEGPAAERQPRGGDRDPFTGELRKRGILPMLVLHFMSEGPSYGNQLIERISAVTVGVLHVNPNTMYPLLRQLEAKGLIEGRWEHPERRSRRYYSLTVDGRREYKRLVKDVRPFLDSIARSIHEIVREVYD